MTRPQSFRSVQEALTYAYSYVAQHYDAPSMYRVLRIGPQHEGKGLHGTDGAAQSGMIRRELQQLTPDQQNILAVRYAPQHWPCHCRRSCCSGKAINAEWESALDELVKRAVSCALAGCVTHYRARRALVVRALCKCDALRGQKADTLEDIAEAVSVHRNTVADHNKRVQDWIRPTYEHAERDVYELLVGCGIVDLVAA